MGIFKSKPGGTLIGNLLRSTTNKLSGGLLGNGAILEANLAKQAAKAAGITPQKVPLANVLGINSDSLKVVTNALADAAANNPEVKKIAVTAFWDNYKQYIIGGVVLVAGFCVYWFKFRKPKFKGFKRR